MHARDKTALAVDVDHQGDDEQQNERTEANSTEDIRTNHAFAFSAGKYLCCC